jgi:hypothetical protein
MSEPRLPGLNSAVTRAPNREQGLSVLLSHNKKS